MTDRTLQTVIENGIVKTVQTQVLYEATLDSVLANLITQSPVTISNIPKDTLHYSQHPTPNGIDATFIVEQYPTIRNIIFVDGRHSDPKAYKIHLPFVYFTFKLNTTDKTGQGMWNLSDWRVFMNNMPVTSTDEPLLAICMPNSYVDGRTCAGSVTYNRGDGTLSSVAQFVMNTYWASTFNTDLDIIWPDTIENFEQWQNHANNDPMQWMMWEQTWASKESSGTPMSHIFGNTLKFDDEITMSGMIPQLRRPHTYNEFDLWLNKMPKEDKEKVIANIMGHQQFHIRVPERG